LRLPMTNENKLHATSLSYRTANVESVIFLCPAHGS
jgi:hypothetical protein